METGYNVLVSKLSKEDGGGYLAEVPALPGCMSDGETMEEAVRNAQDAIAAWIEAAREMGRPIPEPESEAFYSGHFVVRATRSLHRDLTTRAKIEGVSLNQLAIALLSGAIGMGEVPSARGGHSARAVRYKRAARRRSSPRL